MEIIHKEEKYRAYLKKIQSAKSEVSQKMSRRSVVEKVDLAYSDMMRSNDSSEYNFIYWMLVIPLFIVFTMSYFQFGGYIRLIPIALLILFIISSRISMTSKKKLAHQLKVSVSAEKLRAEYLPAKIRYISQGIKVKLQRVKNVRVLYALFFPLLVTLLIELVRGTHIFGNFWVSLLIAYLICGLFWWLYFVSDIDYLEYMIDDFKSDLSNLSAGLV